MRGLRRRLGQQNRLAVEIEAATKVIPYPARGVGDASTRWPNRAAPMGSGLYPVASNYLSRGLLPGNDRADPLGRSPHEVVEEVRLARGSARLRVPEQRADQGGLSPALARMLA